MKVAILGGGMAGMAAAWHLSQDPNCKVTVFQRDGLLGGKCASTRSADPSKGERIQEHGIHLLMGFYDQALTMLRDCYATPGLTGALPWNYAFTPCDAVTMGSEPNPGNWDFWTVHFPPNNLPIGGDGKPAKVEDLLRGAFRWLVAFLGMVKPQLATATWVTTSANAMVVFFALVLKLSSWGLPVGWLFGIVRWWLDKVVTKLWPLVQLLIPLNPQVGQLWIGIWLIATNLRGLIVDGIVLPPHNFSVIDGHDYRDWLKLRGVITSPPIPPEYSWNSPPVRALYDIAFAIDHALAAGVVAYNALNIGLDYKGHFAYRMNAGMGETVFTPLYKVLHDFRGVQFRFFHEVTALQPGVDAMGRPVIDRVDVIDRTPGVPLGPVNNTNVRLPDNTVVVVNTWPESPAPGPATPRQLLRTGPVGQNQEQFDVFVLAISVGGLRTICTPLAFADPGFWAMVVTQRSLQTQSAQLWMDKTPSTLGAPAGPTVISFERPFNSWVDMGQTLDAENWAPGFVPGPQAISYFCDELPEADTIGQPNPNAVVRARLEHFLVNRVGGMWPTFSLADLHDPNAGVGTARINFQYWRANVDPSDRYVIPMPGVTALRREPAASGFHNLALAGDWTHTKLNSGCVEAAVQAGEAAAEAIRAGKIS